MSLPVTEPVPRKLRVLVVDDEVLSRDRLRAVLEATPGLEIVGECGDGVAAVAAIEAAQPDLVLLDVQMPGLDGFGVIEEIGVDRMPPVVFVTAHDVYALRAFEARAIDYLLKPFDDERLTDVLSRVDAQIRLREEGRLVVQFRELLQHMASANAVPARGPASETYLVRLTVRDDDCVRFLPVADIDWFEGDGNYVRIHIGDRVCRIRRSLAALRERLDPRDFVRIHKSTIINVERVIEVQPWFGGDYVAIMRNGEKLRVSRTYASDLIRQAF